MSLATIRALRQEKSLPSRAHKLLSFTDNRQDASLQAGHFNDFVEIGLLRSALYNAVHLAGPSGVKHEELTQRVFDALHLDFSTYSSDAQVRFQAKLDTELALRNVLGYRLYRDLQRGWRITSPNLEQCGLLEIHYNSLQDICQADDLWQNCIAALANASSDTRLKIAKVLLDYMRRELAIKVDYLERLFLERIRQQSSQRLIPPWAIDEGEKLEYGARLFPRPQRPHDHGGDLYLSARGGFGQYLRRVLSPYAGNDKLSLDIMTLAISQLLENLRIGGVIERVVEPNDANDVPGYQVVAASMRWVAGDGCRAFHDPIRVPNHPEEGGRTNPFFVNFYKNIGSQLVGFEAREHTAQVPYQIREEREAKFREGTLPILYCSPTMELGVDISQLNAVNLRNVPPTPANYAQRSGRAGRSGQPALVFSYCTTGSSHDRYFFRRPHRMVSGAVSPPRLDLANEDLIRAHIHAIWLAETGLRLGMSLKDILDLAGENPTLKLQPHIQDAMAEEAPRRRALYHARLVLKSIADDLGTADWYSDGWLEEIFNQVAHNFDQACERWRNLYRAALRQREIQNKIIGDASRDPDDRAKAKRLRQEAESQLELLTQGENVIQSDFYSYRYFASEGFLPGYSFPRLPLSAFIPGYQRQKSQHDEFLSRSRFLAISEFGPQSIVYHEGSKYKINKVILPPSVSDDLMTGCAKLCPHCGYLHPTVNGQGQDLCDFCGAALHGELRQLFRLQNVSTKRRERINCDEEERFRLGYDIQTTVRFVEHGGRTSYRTAEVKLEEHTLAKISFGQAATIWRINLGWKNRARKDENGFILDIERGYWEGNKLDPDEAEDDPLSPRRVRVIPFVEDHRNSLLIQFTQQHSDIVMASIEAALKNAIQVRYQLEESELSAEPLPGIANRRLILFYESAEGGAGVLRQLVDDPQAFSNIAHEALELCHFDPTTGEDKHRAVSAREDCEAACYDCLMSYSNQREHDLLDRQAIRGLLLQLAKSQVITAPADIPRAEHFNQLIRIAGSELEIRWLRWMNDMELRLPTRGQVLLEQCRTRPDFVYDNHQAAIYVDGPPHEYPEQQIKDRTQTSAMEDYGYTVIRFRHDDEWLPIVQRYPHVFGTPVDQNNSPAADQAAKQ
jgi:very-short-patch-repair endonuclease